VLVNVLARSVSITFADLFTFRVVIDHVNVRRLVVIGRYLVAFLAELDTAFVEERVDGSRRACVVDCTCLNELCEQT
jgi:hypothetical protein